MVEDAIVVNNAVATIAKKEILNSSLVAAKGFLDFAKDHCLVTKKPIEIEAFIQGETKALDVVIVERKDAITNTKKANCIL